MLLDVFGTQEALDEMELQAEDAYATTHLDSASAAVSLYKSLAGGWPQRPPQPVRTGKP